MAYRVGVDIGGTFTDFTVVDDEGALTLWKQDTNPESPTTAIALGLEAVAAELGTSVGEFLGATTLFVHGTTIATNTLIQRNGPTVGLLCTEGFRDVLYLRDGFKPDRFNVHMEHPGTFVDRYLRLPVGGRIDRYGNVMQPLDEEAVRAAADTFREAGVESVAVAFLWSMVNGDHEHRAAELLRELLPGVSIICSADVLPEIREWERTSAAVLSAYVLPGIGGYLHELEELLRTSGYGRGPLIMQINGGCAPVAEILRRPVNVLASGPAAAPAAAGFHVRRHGWNDVITVDMGGTSLDVCVIRGGRATMSREIQVEHQPIGVPGVEVQSVGAGGGSIAWIDSGGALRVGPRSAGARPGPAAYGAGGTEPTVTDANVVLGYLAPEAFLGGRRTLDGALAARSVQEKVGDPLRLSTLDAAAGIIRLVNANMVNAIRAVSVERGIDPRGFALVAGGGAGGLHAARLARELGMRHLMIPREAGTFCAFGMTVTDVRHDEAAAHHAMSTDDDLSAVDGLFDRLEETAIGRLTADGFTRDAISLERTVDARYPGQVHELTIPLPASSGYGRAELAAVETAFHAEHERQFTYARPDLPVEFLHWRLSASGHLEIAPEESVNATGEASDALVGEREVYVEEHGGLTTTPVYRAELLAPGATLDGPAIVQAATTTIVINPGDVLTVQPDLGFAVEIAVPALVGG